MNKHKQHEKEIAENDLVSILEEKIGYLKPYWSKIALGACAVILAILGGVFLWQQGQSAEADKWQNLSTANNIYQLNLSRGIFDNSSLSDFADQYPDDRAGMWALLLAGDAELRSGLTDLSTDRKAGFDKIKKAQKFYQDVVDSPVQKSTMLQRRSLYGLAYSSESNGEFKRAAELYQQLLESGEENPFYDEAKRGIERSSNPEFAKLFTKFQEYEVAPDEAPGMILPQRPDITFPDLGRNQPDSGGGDFAGPTKTTSDSDGLAAEQSSSKNEAETEDPIGN